MLCWLCNQPSHRDCLGSCAPSSVTPYAMGRCLHCRSAILAHSPQAWALLVKLPCPYCNQPGW